MKKIFITGASGCVGHYLFDLLAPDPNNELYLLMRRPEKLKRDLARFPNVKVIKEDISNIAAQAELLKEMEYLVHIAACWGQVEVNYHHTLKMFNLLDPAKVKKIIYFSTASLLDENNRVLPFMGEIGTSYIEGKFLCHKALKDLKVYDKIVTLFPTWVLGGDAAHPYSHAMAGILAAKKWLWLLRFLTIDLSFHFIHSADIALVVEYLLNHDTDKNEYVLGNDLITATDLIKDICAFYHRKVYWQLGIPLGAVKFLFGRWLSNWDKYCLTRKVFKHQVVSPADFGLKRKYPTIESVLTAQ